MSAKIKGIRTSPQKMRLVADQVRGLSVDDALYLLEFSNKKASKILKKLLESAIANAENNDGADIDELSVSEIIVDAGRTMKRLRTRSKGRADRIIKRTSHVKVTVSAVGGN